MSILLSLAFSAVLLLACLSDIRHFRIPNALPLALIAIFFMKAALMADLGVWPWHLAAFGLMLGLGMLAFAGGIIGGGDAKLMAAVALWIGMAKLPDFLVMTAIGGGVLGLVLMVLRHIAARAPATSPPIEERSRPGLLSPKAPVPYALPIALAALWLEWL